MKGVKTLEFKMPENMCDPYELGAFIFKSRVVIEVDMIRRRVKAEVGTDEVDRVKTVAKEFGLNLIS